MFRTISENCANGRVQRHFEPSRAGFGNLHVAPPNWHDRKPENSVAEIPYIQTIDSDKASWSEF